MYLRGRTVSLLLEWVWSWGREKEESMVTSRLLAWELIEKPKRETDRGQNLSPNMGTPTEKAMAPHSSTLAWKIPWMEEPGGLQSMGSLRVRHDWATSLSLSTFMHWRRKWQPTPVFLPGESQGRGSLVGCRLWGCTESDMTEATQQQHGDPKAAERLFRKSVDAWVCWGEIPPKTHTMSSWIRETAWSPLGEQADRYYIGLVELPSWHSRARSSLTSLTSGRWPIWAPVTHRHTAWVVAKICAGSNKIQGRGTLNLQGYQLSVYCMPSMPQAFGRGYKDSRPKLLILSKNQNTWNKASHSDPALLRNG